MSSPSRPAVATLVNSDPPGHVILDGVQTVSLSIEESWELAGLLLASGTALAVSRVGWVRNVGALFRETSVIGFLYGLWHYAGQLADAGTRGAYAHARWIERFERDLHLPSEAWTQHLVLGHKLVIQTANLYYAALHLSGMLVFLLWLFLRHRNRYRPIRQVMAWTTLACLLVQLIPVAPPRLLGGIVDTGLLYNQSVYSNGLPIDQLAAMPSVHVAWAVIVGYYAWRVSSSRWRWIGPIHAVLTILIVVVTGNHYWLDGIVAVALLIVCAWGVAGARTAWHALRRTALQRLSASHGPRPSALDAGPSEPVAIASSVGVETATHG